MVLAAVFFINRSETQRGALDKKYVSTKLHCVTLH